MVRQRMARQDQNLIPMERQRQVLLPPIMNGETRKLWNGVRPREPFSDVTAGIGSLPMAASAFSLQNTVHPVYSSVSKRYSSSRIHDDIHCIVHLFLVLNFTPSSENKRKFCTLIMFPMWWAGPGYCRSYDLSKGEYPRPWPWHAKHPSPKSWDSTLRR